MLLISIPFAFAWDDCVSGEVNCEYPGDCASYIDTNLNQICDHSEPIPSSYQFISLSVPVVVTEEHDLITGKELKEKTIEEVAVIYNIDKEEYAKLLSDKYQIQISTTDSFQLLHDEYGLEPTIAKEIANEISLESKQLEIKKEAVEIKVIKYHPIQILAIISILYFASWFLTKKEKLSITIHRKIWNILLLTSFVVTAVLGFLTTTQIVYGWPITRIRNLHVDPGIAFVTIGFFHTFWHIPYLKRILKFKD